jgi:L-lactate utilization protein LutB
MNSYKKWQSQCIAKEAVEILQKKHYNACYAEDLQEARKMVLNMIPEGASIALGGSVTLSDMNIIDTLRSDRYNLFDRYQKLPHDEIVEIMRQSLLADVLLTGTNAITRQGELVNLDCSGNRVAGMIFGPKKVIIVAGANKVVDTLDDAMKRLKQIAPLNAKRIKHETPCTETGRCMDCQIQKRLCNYMTVIYHGMKFEGRLNVIMVAEETGL